MFFGKKRSGLSRQAAALIARGLAWDFLRSEESFEAWVMQSDLRIEQEATKNEHPRITKSEVAQIFRQALYFVTERRDDMFTHIKEMDSFDSALESGIYVSIPLRSGIADYMNDLPYLCDFEGR